jgi:chromosome segregation ATPase
LDKSTFEKHATFDAIKAIREAFAQMDPDVLTLPEVKDAKLQFEYSKWCLEKSAPELFVKAEMTDLQNQFNPALAQVNSMASNPTGHATNFSNHMVQVRNILPAPRKKVMLKAKASETIQFAEDAFTESKKSANQVLEDLKSKIADSQETLNGLTNEIENAKQQATQLGAQYETQLTAWSEKIDASIAKKDAEGEKAITEFEKSNPLP